jgi:hypothetical protein
MWHLVQVCIRAFISIVVYAYYLPESCVKIENDNEQSIPTYDLPVHSEKSEPMTTYIAKQL